MSAVLDTTVQIDSELSKKIVLHHLESFIKNDLQAVVNDYGPDSILITQDATYRGIAEIRGFFAALMIYFPEHLSVFELDKIETSEDLVYIVWHATTPKVTVPLGTDSFVIKNGKIAQQTFAGVLNFNP